MGPFRRLVVSLDAKKDDAERFVQLHIGPRWLFDSIDLLFTVCVCPIRDTFRSSFLPPEHSMLSVLGRSERFCPIMFGYGSMITICRDEESRSYHEFLKFRKKSIKPRSCPVLHGYIVTFHFSCIVFPDWPQASEREGKGVGLQRIFDVRTRACLRSAPLVSGVSIVCYYYFFHASASSRQEINLPRAGLSASRSMSRRFFLSADGITINDRFRQVPPGPASAYRGGSRPPRTQCQHYSEPSHLWSPGRRRRHPTP